MENISDRIRLKNGKSKLIIDSSDYVNYKMLKQTIKKTINSFLIERDRERVKEFNTFEEITLQSPSSSQDSNNLVAGEKQKTPSNDQANLIDSELKNFLKLLDTEIKRVYLFFVNKERELYVSINSHLHIRQTFSSFNLRSTEKEFNELYNISFLTYNLSKFISMNTSAIKKILKKFDKHFEPLYGRIGLKYIQKKLEGKNSDLLYVLQFKIIDEVSALLEDLVSDLRLKFQQKKNINLKNSNASQISMPLINNSPMDDFNRTEAEISLRIARFVEQLQLNLYLIDENNQNFRTNFKDWHNFLKTNAKTYGNNFNSNPNTTVFGISSKDKSYLGYDIISGGSKNNLSHRRDSMDSNIILSEDNLKNINFTLFHTFFYMFQFTLFLPTVGEYVKHLKLEGIYSGAVMAMTSVGGLLSLSICNRMVNYSYKKAMILSAICFILGNTLYFLAYVANSYIMLLAARFIIGVGANRTANRSYLITYLPKNKVTKYLFYFQISTLTGMAVGPLVSIPLIYFNDFVTEVSSTFNDFTIPAIFCIVISIILFVLVLVSYAEPQRSNFTIYKEEVFDSAEESSARSSRINVDRISQAEKDILYQIDEKLSDFNQANKYSDTNLVATSIEQIAWREKKTVSYLYICFIVFAYVMTVCKFLIESLLVISPIYITDLNKSADLKLIALLMSAAMLLVLPAGFLISHYLNTRIRDRRMMVYLIIFCILTNFLIMNIFYTSLVQYCIIFVFLLIGTYLLESVSTTMFSKIIPADYEVMGMNAGVVMQFWTTIGKIFGALMLSIVGLAGDTYLNIVTFGISLGLLFVALIVSLCFYSYLRVKAIARILRAKSMRKLKNSEF